MRQTQQTAEQQQQQRCQQPPPPRVVLACLACHSRIAIQVDVLCTPHEIQTPGACGDQLSIFRVRAKPTRASHRAMHTQNGQKRNSRSFTPISAVRRVV